MFHISLKFCFFAALSICIFISAAMGIQWEQKNNISYDSGVYEVTGPDPWLLSESLSPAAAEENSYLIAELKVSSPAGFQCYWWKKGQGGHFSRMHTFMVSVPRSYVTVVYDLDRYGRFDGADFIRLGPAAPKGFKFQIKDIKLMSKQDVPDAHFKNLVEMKCFTSKLHYLPDERIEYETVLLAKNYPETRSSKILKTKITDSKGNVIHSQLQHYGIADIENRKELFGYYIPDKKLKPGSYLLDAESIDQMTGFVLNDSHTFSVIDESFPYIYETPFKYVKDFSIIRDEQGLWHIFSITGEFIEGHDWIVEGNERTFSHGTSPDLRNWTYHTPVLSISDKKYSDGNGCYEDKGVWAPNVIYHQDKYYMFYTSTNKYVSQSISLAISDDLFHWKKYEKNPVFNLEGLDWANWARNRWADCRDPEIFKDGDIFYMYVTAHASGGNPRGIVAVAQSTDLLNWTNPKIAVRHHHAMESPQVWKNADKYLMTTSAHGGGVWVSDSPDKNWKLANFPRPDILSDENIIKTSTSYAEEVYSIDQTDIIAGLTWRHFGNSIYIYQMNYNSNGLPAEYVSPFDVP